MNTQIHLNGFFSFTRWYCLFCADLRLNLKRYLLIFLGALAVGYLALGWDMHGTQLYQSQNYFIIISVGLMALALFAGNPFPEFNHKTGTADYLLLPASTFEKLLTQILIYVVLGSICYLLIFWVDAHLARWTVMAGAAAQSKQVVIEPFRYAILWEEMERPYVVWLGITGIGISLFALRLFFKRYAFVKSVLVLFGLFGFWCCFMVGCSHLFYPETQGFNIHFSDFKMYNGMYLVEVYFLIMAHCIWLTAFPLAYYKLKEKKL